MLFNNILTYYGLTPTDYTVTPFGSGLINRTWKVSQHQQPRYILQQINTSVFKHPQDIAQNIRTLGNYLQQHYPGYLFAGALPGITGNDLYVADNHQYYRLFPFIAHSHSAEVVHTPQQAFEAARQFARFTFLLRHFDAGTLKITIPHFHDLPLRYLQFNEALKKGNPERIALAADVIIYLQQQVHL